MVRLVNVHDAKSNLSKLLQEVERGEEVLIGRAGQPVAKLVPVTRTKREFGTARDQVWIADDFDATSDELVAQFYGDGGQ